MLDPHLISFVSIILCSLLAFVISTRDTQAAPIFSCKLSRFWGFHPFT